MLSQANTDMWSVRVLQGYAFRQKNRDVLGGWNNEKSKIWVVHAMLGIDVAIGALLLHLDMIIMGSAVTQARCDEM